MSKEDLKKALIEIIKMSDGLKTKAKDLLDKISQEVRT